MLDQFNALENQIGSELRNEYMDRFHSREEFCAKNLKIDECKRIEDAFWKKIPLRGRQITSADVLDIHGNDRTSLRSGFFLQKLCLQNILLGNKKVTPDQVIQEFNRVRDRYK